MNHFLKIKMGAHVRWKIFKKDFEVVLGKNLEKFFKWFHEPGTPKLFVSEKFVAKNYKVTFRQEKPINHRKYSNKVMPITYKILNSKGQFLQPEKRLYWIKKHPQLN